MKPSVKSAKKKTGKKGKKQNLGNERLNNLPKFERYELWKATRAKILSSQEYKDATPQQLKILEYVMDGSIRSEIIETFIQEEEQKIAE